MNAPQAHERLIHIPAGAARIDGALHVPAGARAIVLFAHGSGSSRHSPRNGYVARVLNGAGFGTLLMDLLTAREDLNHETRFDIGLLTERLLDATRWVQGQPGFGAPALGYFGASTGAAAALQAAAKLGAAVGAVVSRGGRPDLAGAAALQRVRAPTLLVVGQRDEAVLRLNRDALAQLRCAKELAIVPDATHLFEEPGTLEAAARLAAAWFGRWLGAPPG